jgi:hypothetical protein
MKRFFSKCKPGVSARLVIQLAGRSASSLLVVLDLPKGALTGISRSYRKRSKTTQKGGFQCQPQR